MPNPSRQRIRIDLNANSKLSIYLASFPKKAWPKLIFEMAELTLSHPQYLCPVTTAVADARLSAVTSPAPQPKPAVEAAITAEPEDVAQTLASGFITTYAAQIPSTT